MRERVHRVLRELRWHHLKSGATTQSPADDILTVDTAEAAKFFLSSDVPEYPSGLASPCATLAPLWDRIALARACACRGRSVVAPQEPEIGRRALETRGGPVHISRRRARSLRTRTAAGLDARLYAVALLKVTGVVGSIVIAV
eukprot:9471528-Pyramimonas_sp.AAC.1